MATISRIGSNQSITGTSSADFITGVGSRLTVDGGAGNDTINVTGNTAKITGGSGADIISAIGSNVTADGGDGNDDLSGTGGGISLYGGAGNDILTANPGDSSVTTNDAITLNGGAGSNTLVGSKYKEVFLNGGGNDTIVDYGTEDTISIAGSSEYTRETVGTSVVISVTGGGTMNVQNASGKSLNVQGGTLVSTGGKNISNYNSNTLISGTANADSISIGGNYVTLLAGDGDDTITNFATAPTETSLIMGRYVSINAGAGNDVISNNGAYAKIDGGAGGDSINNSPWGINSSINGGAAADTILNSGAGSTLLGGAGNDIIVNSAANVLVDGGDDSDFIVAVSNFTNTTLRGGAGNDTFNTSDTVGHIYQYAKGDGNDIIYGVNNSDIISIGGATYSKSTVGTNLVLNITGGGAITLSGASTKTPSILGTLDSGVINNTIYNVVVNGTSGADTIKNSGAHVTIYGGAGNDSISNWCGEVTISGGDGNDTILGYYWNSSINGGAGNDVISLVSGGGQHVGKINAGTGNDTVYANSGSTHYRFYQYKSGDGSDVIYGFDANDTLEITGASYSTQKSGSDAIVKVGNDTITLKNAANVALNIIGTLDSGVINNTIYNVVVNGTSGADTIKNSGAHVTIYGGAGNDSISNWCGEVTISGGDGNDTILGYYWNSSINGGAGNDVFSLVSGGGQHVGTINAGTGNDTVYANSGSTHYRFYQYKSGDGSDVIYGFDANDTLEITGASYSTVASGSDAIVKVGSDTITLKNAANVALNIIGTLDSGVINNTIYNVVVNGTSGADTIKNSGAHVTIYGGAGNDSISNWCGEVTISGGEGNDTILGYYWKSSINGGAGNDVISLVSGGGQHVGTINAGTGNDTVYANSGSTHYRLYQYKSGDGSDVIYGFDANDTLEITGASYSTQKSGSDAIVKVGSDTITLKNAANVALNIIGTLNADITLTSAADSIDNTVPGATISGLGGDDTIRNNDLSCKNVSISGGDGNDSIGNRADGATISGDAGNDHIDNRGNNSRVYGGAGNDWLHNDSIGNTGSNATLDGGAGNDSLENWGQYAVLQGGSDNDFIYNVGDDVSILAGDGADIVINAIYNSASNFSGKRVTISGGNGNDSILNRSGGDSVKIYGDNGDDTIDNYGSRNTILGGAGNDIIKILGGGGNTVQGGAGNDSISLSSSSSNNVIDYYYGDGDDTVYGYKSGDVISIAGTSQYITLASGSDKIVSLIGGGSMTFTNASSTALNISGGTLTVTSPAGKTINNTVSGTVINGGDGDDSVYSYANDTTILTGAGNDTVQISFANNPYIDTGDGNDSVWGNNNSATIYTGAGNDTIVGNHATSILDAGAGNDVVSIVTTYWRDTIDGGDGDDTIISAGNYASVNGGAGADVISLSGDNLTVQGGTGADIIYGSTTTSHLYEYKKGDGNDTIYGFNERDTITLTGGNYKLVTTGGSNDATVSVTGGEKLVLKDAKGKTININNKSVGAEITPQEVIEQFMASLDKSTLKPEMVELSNGATIMSAENMLDEAIKACSNFNSIQEVIDKMVADCEAYNAANRTDGWSNFLMDKCDIILGDDEDTGAITGSNAGGSTVDKTASSVVKETGTFDSSFTDSSFTLKDYGVSFGLTKITSVNGRTIFKDGIDFNSLKPNEQYIWQGLYSYWAKAALDLIAESYGSNYGFGSKSSATTKTIYFGFTNTADGNLGTTWQAWLIDGDGNPIDGKTTALHMALNINNFASLVSGNEDGQRSGKTTYYTDRVLAHEFTHAVMNANISYHFNLPQFIKDGMCELTHGCDDDREDEITNLAKDPDGLRDALSLTTNSYGAYAGGFMFYRYLAKQASSAASDSTNNASTAMSASGNVYSNSLPTGISVKSATLTASKNYAGSVIDVSDYSAEISRVNATAQTKDITIFGGSANESIKSGSGADKVYGGAGNDTLYGGSGADTLFGGSGNDKLYGEAGNDELHGGAGTNTLTGGAGNDIFVYEGGNDFIDDYKAGEDKIRLLSGDILSASVSGSNVIFKTSVGGNITVKGGKDKKITFADANGNETVESYPIDNGITVKSATLTAGTKYAEDIIDLADYATSVTKVNAAALSRGISIVGTAAANSIKGGSGADTISGGAGNDTVSLGGGADVYVYSSGNDYIHDYTAGQDKIKLVGASITGSSLSGSNVVLKTSGGNITVKSGKGKQITVIDASGKETTNIYPLDTLPAGISVSGAILTASTAFTGSKIDLADYATTVTKVNAAALSRGISIVGTAAANSLKGGKGADTITGGAGNDTVSLGGGADVYVYSSGNDYIHDYTAGQDKIKLVGASITGSSLSGSNVVLKTSGGNITVKSGKGKQITVIDASGKTSTNVYPLETLPAGISVSGATLTASSAFTGTAIDLADYASTVTRINSMAVTRKTSLIGSAKANYIAGGTGADTIDGLAGNDTIYGGAGADKIYGGAGNDKLYGDAGNDTLYGDAGNDTLEGGAGNDILDGGAGNDTLTGGAGNDTLTGGAGNDVFVYANGDGKDVIADYAAGDKIKITSGAITKTAYSGNNVVFTVGSGTLTVKDGKGKAITVVDASGKTSTKTYSSGVVYGSNGVSGSNGYWFAEDDTNFISGGANLDEISAENYSVANFETMATTTTIAQAELISITSGGN